jgi:Lipocalin-like domain
MRTMCNAIVALSLCVTLAAGTAGAQELKEKTIKEQLVGAWSVISVVVETDGKKTEPFGPTPKGMFIFTADGHFATNIIGSDRQKFSSNNRATGTADENKAAVSGNISTFGTYAVSSDGSIEFHIVGSSFPNWDDAKQKRLVEIKGEEIIWKSPTGSIGGSESIRLQRAGPMPAK